MTARTGFVCAVAAVLLLLAGCSTPLPPERAAYAGVWRNGATMLAISPQGRVIYRVERGNGFRKSIERRHRPRPDLDDVRRLRAAEAAARRALDDDGGRGRAHQGVRLGK